MKNQNSEIKTKNELIDYSIGKRVGQGINAGGEDYQLRDSYIDENGIPVIRGTGEVLEDVSSSGKPRNWSGKKGENLELVKVLEEMRKLYPELVSDSRMHQIDECANYLKFGITGDKQKRLKDANFCRFRMCPVCIWRKSLKMFSQISLITDRLNKEYPTSRYIFVTFTVKNCSAEELSFTIDKLNRGFKFLVQDKATMADSKVFKDSLLGYIKCLEITYNSKQKTYHPHIHTIFHLKSNYFKRNYLSHSKWVALWRSMMKLDYDPIVNVKNIKDSKNPKVLAEIAKYPIKSSDIIKIDNSEEQVEVLSTLTRTTYHRRLVTFGGTFKEVKRALALDDIDSGNLVNVEGKEEGLNYVAYEIYKYHFRFGCYIC